MKHLILLLLTLSIVSCKKNDDEVIDLRNTFGEITLEVNLDRNRWGSEDMHIILTLQNIPDENEEVGKYLQNVGGKELPTELSVDWGDGTVNSETQHIYEEYGNYTIVIRGRGLNWYSDEKISHRAVTFLDVKKCPTLQGLVSKIGMARTHTDRSEDLSAFPYLEYLDFNPSLLIESVDLSKNGYLKGVVIYNSSIDYNIDFSILSSLRFVTCMNNVGSAYGQILKNGNINYLQVNRLLEKSDFTKLLQLEELVLSDCNTVDLDFGENTKLKRVNINHSHFHTNSVCPYDDEVVNAIYSKLPSVSATLTTNLPFGDKTIAEKKGWTVVEEKE